MASIDTKTPTFIYVIWLTIAIIGTAVLFTGIQLSVNVAAAGIVLPVMLIVVGIILLFVGLVMVLGYANVEAKSSAKSEGKAKKK